MSVYEKVMIMRLSVPLYHSIEGQCICDSKPRTNSAKAPHLNLEPRGAYLFIPDMERRPAISEIHF
jgi:hypothetical protein